MSNPVNVVALVKSLPFRPRGRACVVLTHRYEGQREWAAELARQAGADHLDLLTLFAQDALLAADIGQLSVSGLFDFLKERSAAPLLVVSGIEFLKATWSGQASASEHFASMVETWDRNPCLCFVLQYDSTLTARPFRRFRQYQFVVDQKETLAL